MRMPGLGQFLFAVSMIVLGAGLAAFPGFVAAWPPVPHWLAGHALAAPLCGALLFAGGIALLFPRTAKPAALILAAVLLLRVLAMKVPPVAAHPLLEAAWYDVGENLTLVAGAWTIFGLLPRESALAMRSGQILFGLALPALGLSHFFYLSQTAPLIPSGLPFHVPLAYLTGAAHIAAGVALLLNVVPRLAATLEAVMVSLFTLLVWVPIVVAAPTTPANWTEICVSTAISGTAWAVAQSLRARPWLARR